LAPLRVTHHGVRATELGQHRRGDLAGVCAVGVGRDVLRAVAEQPLVPVDGRLHGADVGERRQHHHLDRGQVLLGQRVRQLLHQRVRLVMVEVHLPVAGHQRSARFLGGHYDSSASRPGSGLPSRYSSEAPPPVEMWVNPSSGMPSARTAAAESPPPTTVRPSTFVIASATPRVPTANGASSKTPIGPFQNTVRAPSSADENVATLWGPMSSPIRSAGIASAATVSYSASAANAVATT